MKNLFEHYTDGESLYARMVAPVCEKYGLTNMEFNILMFLSNNPKYDTASQIVRYRHLTKSHVSVSVRSLLRRGLLTGVPGKQRSIHLQVNPEAEDIVQEGRAVQKQFTETVFAGFTSEEREQWYRFTQRIDKNIDRYSEGER